MKRQVRPRATTWLNLCIVLAFLVMLGQFPLVSPFAVQLGVSEGLAGVAVSAYSAANLVGNMVIGPWLDRFGANRFLVFSLFGSGMTAVLTGFASSLVSLVTWRILHGAAFAALLPALFALLGEAGGAQRHAQMMGKVGAGIGVAALTGPALAGAVNARYGYRAAFGALGFVLVAASFLTWRVGLSGWVAGSPRRPSLWRIVTDRSLLAAWLGAFSLMFAQGALVYVLPLEVGRAGGFDATAVGLLFSVFAGGAMVALLTPLRKYLQRMDCLLAASLGFASMAVGMASIHVAGAFSGWAAGMALCGGAFGWTFAALGAHVLGVAGRHLGSAFGLFYGFFSLGSLSAPLLIGLLSSLVPGFVLGAAVEGAAAGAIVLLGRRAKLGTGGYAGAM